MGVWSLFENRPHYHLSGMPGKGDLTSDVGGTATAPSVRKAGKRIRERFGTWHGPNAVALDLSVGALLVDRPPPKRS
jgi:hypothetical protein